MNGTNSTSDVSSRSDGHRRGLKRSHLRSALGISAIVVGFLTVALTLYLVEIASGLPSLEELENPHPDLSTKVFTADGQPLDQFFVHNRTYIPLDSIPKKFIQALIATEDQKFYDHWGVNLERILKAVVKNVLAMDLTKEGASTITQQLARNLYLSQEVTIARKIREQLTAVQIERTYTKNEILELYANTVYFGRGAYGIQVASEVYFDKLPIDLSVDQCAYLVGMLKAPENYDVSHYGRAVQRRNTVMKLMTEVGYLSRAQYREASQRPIVLAKPKRRRSIAPHFVEAVRLALQKEPKLQGYNLYRDGLVIYTTIDSRMQKYANEAVREHLDDFQPRFDRTWSWKRRPKLLKSIVEHAARQDDRYQSALTDAEKSKVFDQLTTDESFIDSVKKEATQIEVGFVVIEPRTGFVRAMVGGRDMDEGRGLNHVTQIRRQPGSAFKPFVYASALQQGMHPNSGISAAPVVYRGPGGEVWAPKGGRGGWVTLASALKYSMNTVAARLILEKTTPAKVVKLAKEMGIESHLPEYPSIALGSAEVTPMEITAAFGTFPNQGVYVAPTLIAKVEDRYGNVIYQADPVMHDVLSPGIAGEMIEMMRGVVDGGTGSIVRNWFKYPAGGKTGTTQRFADAWFVGYTPQLVAGTWVGFDDHRIKFTGWYGQGGKAAAPIWGRFMGKVYNDDRLPYDKMSFDMGERRSAYDGTMASSDGSNYRERSSNLVNSAPPSDAFENGPSVTNLPNENGTETTPPANKPPAPPTSKAPEQPETKPVGPQLPPPPKDN